MIVHNIVMNSIWSFPKEFFFQMKSAPPRPLHFSTRNFFHFPPAVFRMQSEVSVCTRHFQKNGLRKEGVYVDGNQIFNVRKRTGRCARFARQ